MDIQSLTVREFLALCLKHGWHFTHTWVMRRVRELEKEHEA